MVEIFDHNCPLYEFDPSLQRTTEAGSGWLLQARVLQDRCSLSSAGGDYCDQTPDRRSADLWTRSQYPVARDLHPPDDCSQHSTTAHTAPAGLQAAGCIKPLHAVVHASPIH